jgi:leucyl aminopeptidase
VLTDFIKDKVAVEVIEGQELHEDALVVRVVIGDGCRLRPAGVDIYELTVPKASVEDVRRCVSKAVEHIFESSDVITFDLTGIDVPEVIYAVVESSILTVYRFLLYLGGSHAKSLKFSVLPEFRHVVRDAAAIADAVNFTRDLANQPANVATPEWFENIARELARQFGFEIHVLDDSQLEREGYNLIRAVGGGSVHKPKIVHLVYRKGTPKRRIAFVGKGITFDSGGLDIKSPDSMALMKFDKTGAATVLGILYAAARLGLKDIELHGVLALAENMPDGASYRPGDIFDTRIGKTVEITNTDAEGRLALADGFMYIAQYSPDIVIDLATLTGGAKVALGDHIAAYFSNDDALAAAIEKAFSEVGEKIWRLPLDEDLRQRLHSTVADIANSGGRFGSPITAALFLREFVPQDSEWVHIDLTTGVSRDNWYYNPKGATGFGVRGMIRFLEMMNRED